MVTTDNEIVHDDDPKEESKLQHQNQTGNEQVVNGDSGKTQEQIDAEQRDIAQKVQDKQTVKLNHNTKPGLDSSEDDK